MIGDLERVIGIINDSLNLTPAPLPRFHEDRLLVRRGEFELIVAKIKRKTFNEEDEINTDIRDFE